MVPTFTYVYHEYGGIRIDGWGKLADAIEDLFYHTVAKTYLWGALYELNYEYSPLKMIDGKVNKYLAYGKCRNPPHSQIKKLILRIFSTMLLRSAPNMRIGELSGKMPFSTVFGSIKTWKNFIRCPSASTLRLCTYSTKKMLKDQN